MDETEKKAELKKLNARAIGLKMDLHDLAESLPTDWETILEVANRTYEAFQKLDEFKKTNG